MMSAGGVARVTMPSGIGGRTLVAMPNDWWLTTIEA